MKRQYQLLTLLGLTLLLALGYTFLNGKLAGNCSDISKPNGFTTEPLQPIGLPPQGAPNAREGAAKLGNQEPKTDKFKIPSLNSNCR